MKKKAILPLAATALAAAFAVTLTAAPPAPAADGPPQCAEAAQTAHHDGAARRPHARRDMARRGGPP